MRIALIADAFPPLRSSAAVQLRDLAREFVKQGHALTVFIPTSELKVPFQEEHWCGMRIIRLKAPKTKDIGYVRRTWAELLMPFVMFRNFKKSPARHERWEGIVWYSPTIFLGPLVSALKRISACSSYLIIRDIFPEWAADMGLMGRGLPYKFFKAIANYQYSVADTIGVQTVGNQSYFSEWAAGPARNLEVLQNWLADAAPDGCSIDVSKTPLVGRKLFVYAGNMGVAQGMGDMLELVNRFRDRADVGFVFVGRGSDAQKLREGAKALALGNVAFFDEIDPDEIPGLYAQCHFGLVSLDKRHKTHNIPGKFISYMHSGLPVLANINPGNDLELLINQERVGRVCTQDGVDALYKAALALLNDVQADLNIKDRCLSLSKKCFSAEAAVLQIVRALQQ